MLSRWVVLALAVVLRGPTTYDVTVTVFELLPVTCHPTRLSRFHYRALPVNASYFRVCLCRWGHLLPRWACRCLVGLGERVLVLVLVVVTAMSLSPFCAALTYTVCDCTGADQANKVGASTRP